MDSAPGIASSLRALADPIRRATLLRLAHGPATSGQLADLFSVSRPAVSRHLGVLKKSQLVTVTVRGRHVWYEAQPGPLARLDTWINRLAEQVRSAPKLRSHLMNEGNRLR